jgi:hypothetical protein
VRVHLDRAAVTNKQSYDRGAYGEPYNVGANVWLHNVHRAKGRSPKLDMAWEGPYLVTAKLSDVTYRIQRSQRSRPKVVHFNRLKKYTGTECVNWLAAANGSIPTASVAYLVTQGNSGNRKYGRTKRHRNRRK